MTHISCKFLDDMCIMIENILQYTFSSSVNDDFVNSLIWSRCMMTVTDMI